MTSRPADDLLAPDGGGPPPAAAVRVTTARRVYWTLRRELWESRSLYLAPLAVGALVLVGSLLAAFQLPARMRAGALGHKEILQPYFVASLVLMVTTFLVGVFYALDALQGERRDRSILFWKSLPVSDLTTVLTKAAIPIVGLPLVTVAITVAVQWAMLLVSTAAVAASGGSVAALWEHVPLVPMWLVLLHHMVVVHGLWHAPFLGWLLLVSAWSRRAPFLWAILPPIAVGLVERIAFGTSRFGAMLGSRMAGGAGAADFSPAALQGEHLAMLAPGRVLASPGMWAGLAVTALFLAAAVRLRRRRGPI